MVWIYLTIAGLLEIVWAFSMKQSDGSRVPPHWRCASSRRC
ncbi:MAG: SMR family transporter [Sphingopyxis sp.]